MEAPIIYEDERVLSVNKPPGAVISREEGVFPYAVHRLDTNTSGVVVYAKDDHARQFLQRQFKRREVTKIYYALVEGIPEPKENTIIRPIGRAGRGIGYKTYLPNDPEAPQHLRNAETWYRIVEQFAEYSLLEVRPKTGRTHQIRVHLSGIGHPIAGDSLYHHKNNTVPTGLTRHFLHASVVALTLPDGTEKELRAPLTDDLEHVLATLRYD